MTFEMGMIVCTQAIRGLMEEGPKQEETVYCCLRRHSQEDWGDLCDEDKQMNDDALDMEA